MIGVASLNVVSTTTSSTSSSTTTPNIPPYCSPRFHYCPYCAYTTIITSKLTEHLRTHTSQKPFPCPHCPFEAIQVESIRAHIRTHTGEKPFACVHCPYRSTQKGNLKRHVIKHHFYPLQSRAYPPEFLYQAAHREILPPPTPTFCDSTNDDDDDDSDENDSDATCLSLSPSLSSPPPAEPLLKTLKKVLKATKRVLHFFIQDVTGMNTDAVLGTNIAEGQLQLLTARVEEARYPLLLGEGCEEQWGKVKVEIRELWQAAFRATTKGLQWLKESRPSYAYRGLEEALEPGFWKVNMLAVNTNNSPHDNNNNNNNINASLSTILAGKMKEEDSDICLTQCFGEAEVVARAGFPQHYQDLFMEQGALCGLVGHSKFFTTNWIRSVLSWQRSSGCYGDITLLYQHNTNTTLHRVRRDENLMSCHCLAHRSAVAVAYLGVAARFLTNDILHNHDH
ncbi:hypothetical protein Pcinc_023812 [Petrolisthes cinctipes]|uniref:C2H2-type domain-containing protein n=1 Tax=Petrolisthes cinctipes TaxID=88211 RepID=A0AAE1FCC5_PETCI|nr:hypothetical protein Pcinc_023812 [Petrolisthes cinctipes]